MRKHLQQSIYEFVSAHPGCNAVDVDAGLGLEPSSHGPRSCSALYILWREGRLTRSGNYGGYTYRVSEAEKAQQTIPTAPALVTAEACEAEIKRIRDRQSLIVTRDAIIGRMESDRALLAEIEAKLSGVRL